MNKTEKIALISLGCDKNLVESERILGLVSDAGYETVGDENQADIIVVNTCGFLNAAVEEASEHIDFAIVLKNLGSCRAVIVTGCMAARYKDKIMVEFPEVDAVVPGGPAGVLDAIDKISANQGKTLPRTSSMRRVLSTPGHYAYLKISEGCDNRCAYCAIPMIKGGYKSFETEEILAEVSFLAENGVKEIIIVGQDTSCYGADLYGKPSLDTLIREISKIAGIEWIRLLYCYPEHITDGLIDEIKSNPKVCKYIDMPIQHASDRVLEMMGRKSRKTGILEVIEKLRAAMPDIALRTTVITGFPGETKEDFTELLDFLKDVRFDRLGAFAYSREEGTPAYNMPGQLDEKTKKARKNRVMAVQNAISAEKLSRLTGKRMRVLIEGYDRDNRLFFGRSYMDCPDIDGLVFVRGAGLKNGEFADIIITDALEYDLIGTVCDGRDDSEPELAK